MINEEIANKVVSIEINVLKATYQEILNNINKLHHRSKQHGSLGKLVKAEGNEVKLKDMVKKGQLEEIPVEEAELKEMKKELNRYGVTIANIPITLFFVSIAFMLLVSKVRKTGSFLIMGTIIVLPGFMAANGIGVGLSIIGWLIAEIIATKMKYKDKKAIIIPYVVGSTLQTALFTLPMYMSHAFK